MLFIVALAFVGCSSNDSGPAPGSAAPGDPCMNARECGCWECACTGIMGTGSAQLCVEGKCPTGEDACASVCSTANASVASATAIDSCPAVP